MPWTFPANDGRCTILSQLINVQPGCAAMGLHRDGSYIQLDLHEQTGLDLEVGAIWACQDFTDAVGATRVVLGSHTWPRFRMNKERDYPDVPDVAAEMPAGSCVIYLGQTWHAAGAIIAMGGAVIILDAPHYILYGETLMQ